MAPQRRIAIIGAGFAGIGLAIRLKRAGVRSFVVYERARRLGGVWRDNVYPGAACDIPSHLYSFSFERNYPWTRRYAPQSEILAYLEHCARKHGVFDHIEFDADIASATFSESEGVWKLAARSASLPDADVLVSAVGQFNKPVAADIPGARTFRGAQFHSAAWDRSFSPDGKAVAVIGAGASSIQIVPELARTASSVRVFQRSAPYVFPKPDIAYSAAQKKSFARFPFLRTLDRLRTYAAYEMRIPARASQSKIAGNEDAFRAILTSQIARSDLLEAVTPDHPWGCKRVLLSNDWYPTLSRPNVSVVADRIDRIDPGGVVTDRGDSYPVDAIIHATGFAPARYLEDIEIVGLNGASLRDAWRNGAEAYLGLTTSGFPNFFMMFGPNTNIPGSVLFMLESQMRYIAGCIGMIERKNALYIDVRRSVQDAFNERLHKKLDETIWSSAKCRSWFKLDSGKITTQWPGFLMAYRLKTWRPRAGDFRICPRRLR
ncbi:MAG TPA: NAD(P)/FAD-dependent oxidoreductase [Rhodoblastus sp.]|nr:NAD(P)/FAD-dependent oxidoreductase [Rhodoblastus sp.]